jgi:hypothetical protein
MNGAEWRGCSLRCLGLQASADVLYRSAGELGVERGDGGGRHGRELGAREGPRELDGGPLGVRGGVDRHGPGREVVVGVAGRDLEHG